MAFGALRCRFRADNKSQLCDQVNKYKVANHFTNLSSLLTYDPSGEVDYLDKFDAFEDAYAVSRDGCELYPTRKQSRSKFKIRLDARRMEARRGSSGPGCGMV